MKDLAEFRKHIQGLNATEILKWAVQVFGPDIALATSFGAEDQVLTDLWTGIAPRPRLFTLDTGRLFQETYDVMHATIHRYGIPCKVFAPDTAELARLVERDGPNLFYESIEKRKACCEVRKTRPLARALTGLRAWVTGLRRGQSITRAAVQAIEWDDAHGLYKICPLYDWTQEQVWEYIHDHGVPYNALHDRGFSSIGCAPCTRAIVSGEDIRAGRWWWEQPEHRECGLHTRRQREE